MNHCLRENLGRFLGKRPFTCVYYSEPPRRPIMNGELHNRTIDSEVFGASPLVQTIAGAGYNPIILVSYAFSFESDVGSEELDEFFSLDDWQENSIYYDKVYFAATYDSQNIFSLLEERLGGPRRGVRKQAGRGFVWHTNLKKGESLRLLYFGHEPIPGLRMLT